MLAVGAASVGAAAPTDPALPVEAPGPEADPEPPVATAEPDDGDPVSPDEAAADGLEPPPTLPVHAGVSANETAYAAKVENVGRRFHIMGPAPGILKRGRVPSRFVNRSVVLCVGDPRAPDHKFAGRHPTRFVSRTMSS
jgi:hypothetical protein